MTYDEVIKFLNDNAEESLKNFSKKLTPTNDYIYGVRVPVLRSFAKRIASENPEEFLNFTKRSLEEKQLHGYVLGYMKTEYSEFVKNLEKFSVLIDNWCVCDTGVATFKIIKKHKKEFLNEIPKYLSGGEFQIRLALVILLDYYVEEEYLSYVFDVCDEVKHDGYYVKMAVAWLISVCYVKFPKQTEEYLHRAKLDKFTFNKAVQKTIESFRVSASDKEKLKKMKVK